LNDVTTGNNSIGGIPGYSAAPGWEAQTMPWRTAAFRPVEMIDITFDFSAPT
jgi:hypothetical protein